MLTISCAWFLRAAGLFAAPDTALQLSLFNAATDEYQSRHQGTYLGWGSLRQLANEGDVPLGDMWAMPATAAQLYIDIAVSGCCIWQPKKLQGARGNHHHRL